MTSDQVVSIGSVVIPLVLHGELGKVAEDVLHLDIRVGSLGTSKVVEPSRMKKLVKARNMLGLRNTYDIWLRR